MTEERDDTTSGAGPEMPEPAAEGPAAAEAPPESTAAPVTEAVSEDTAPSAGGSPPGPGDAAAAAGTSDAGDAPAAAAESLAEALPLVEALLFAAAKPVPLDKLAEAAELPEAVVAAAVSALEEACAAAGRGIRVDRVAGGVRVVTRPEYDYPVRRLLGLDGKTKLSMAALETLAIVAYRQPVTAPEVAELRGVNSSSSIRTLLDRKLITTAGRKEVVGTPFLYKTTKEFLVHFGLKGLSDLPKPEELEAIYGLEAPRTVDPAQTELFHVDEATGELEDPGEDPAVVEEPAPAGGSADEVAAAAPADPESSEGGTAPEAAVDTEAGELAAPGDLDPVAAAEAAPSVEPAEGAGPAGDNGGGSGGENTPAEAAGPERREDAP